MNREESIKQLIMAVEQFYNECTAQENVNGGYFKLTEREGFENLKSAWKQYKETLGVKPRTKHLGKNFRFVNEEGDYIDYQPRRIVLVNNQIMWVGIDSIVRPFAENALVIIS